MKAPTCPRQSFTKTEESAPRSQTLSLFGNEKKRQALFLPADGACLSLLLCRKQPVDGLVAHRFVVDGAVDDEDGAAGADPDDAIAELENFGHVRLALQDAEVGVALSLEAHDRQL